MDRQPVLEGARLLLRPLLPQDWEALFAVASNPVVWEQHPQHDRWKEHVFRVFFEDALSSGGAIAILDKESGHLVGSSRWGRYEPALGDSVEIGWTFIDPSLWGGDVNRELKSLMAGHALKWATRAEFGVAADNIRSRKAMEKVGGRLSLKTTIEDTASGPVRYVYYEIDRDNFATGPLSP